MFIALFVMFLVGGSIFCLLDVIMPGVLIPFVALSMRVTGITLIFVGGFLLVSREIQTGADKITGISKPYEKLLFHKRRGGKTFILKGTLAPLEHIVVRNKRDWMIFKDTGGGRNLAKHDVAFTSETVSHTIPEVIAQYIYKIKYKFGVDNLKGLKELHDNLRHISSHEDLFSIAALKDVLNDPEKKQLLMEMKVEDLRRMSECLYDGEIIHMEDYEDFQESAAPYDMESYTQKKITQRIWQYKMYQPMGGAMDYMKWVLAIIILFIGGAIAYQIFLGG